MNIYEACLSAIIIIALIHYGAQILSSNDMMFIKAAREELHGNLTKMVQNVTTTSMESIYEGKEEAFTKVIDEQLKLKEESFRVALDEHMVVWEKDIIGQVNKSFEGANESYRKQLADIRMQYDQEFTSLYNGLFNDFCAKARTLPSNPHAQAMFVQMFPTLKGRFSKETSQQDDKQTATA